MGMLTVAECLVVSYGIKPFLSSASMLGTLVCVQESTGLGASSLSPRAYSLER